MPQKLNKEAILEYLNSWSGFEKTITEEKEAFVVTLSNGNKSVVISTPYEVGEFFLDFTIDDKPYYSDWFEIMDDPPTEFMAYTWQVAANYLSNTTRIISRGWWVFKTHELQFQSNSKWSNVFNPKI